MVGLAALTRIALQLRQVSPMFAQCWPTSLLDVARLACIPNFAVLVLGCHDSAHLIGAVSDDSCTTLRPQSTALHHE